MIGLNLTPELRELLTHHNKRHKSIHLQAKHRLQIKSKTHENSTLVPNFDRNPPLRTKLLRLKHNTRNPKLVLCGTSTSQASTPNNLTLRSYL